MPTHIDWKALREKSERLIEQQATSTGRAISAWNLLQDTLGRLFAEIFHPSNQGMAVAIWYSQDSDRSQRKMLKAAARTAYGEKAKIYEEIKWVCDKTDRLADDRNNVVHVGYSIQPNELFSDVGLRPRGTGSSPRADKLDKRDIFAELEMVEKNSKALFSHVAGIAPHIAYPEQKPSWPERPFLLKTKAFSTPE